MFVPHLLYNLKNPEHEVVNHDMSTFLKSEVTLGLDTANWRYIVM